MMPQRRRACRAIEKAVRTCRLGKTAGIEPLESRVLLANIYVDADSVGATHDGASWSTAYQDLQAALGAGKSGDQVLVASGTYRPTATTDRNVSFQLKNGVSVLGGYAGYGAANPDARDVALYPTILSGDIGALGNNADNSYHVVAGSSGITASTILDGLTITAGNANGNSPANDGGGIYLSSCSPLLINCIFTANVATHGGGIYGNASSPTLTDCIFSINIAGSSGGGLYISYSSSPTLTNCVFSANTAYGAAAIYSDGTPIISNSIVWANSASNGTQISGFISSITYSDIQGGRTGTGNRNVDPLFARAPSAGLDTVWGTADDDYGDLRLRASSPVVDAGNNNAPKLVGITTDMGGSPRFADIPTRADTGSGTAPIIDMGAYETQPVVGAWPGGAYRARQGSGLTLTGEGYSSVSGNLSFAWDWDNDGVYDDATGLTPVFPTDSYSGLITLPISLRVTDGAGQSATAATTITIVPAVLYVDDSAAGTQDGSSWTNAVTSLQFAMGAALPGCEIRVAAGTYKPTSTTDRAISFQLRSNLALYGGYAGFGAANPDARDTALYPTVLSGDIGTPLIKTDNSYHVIKGAGIDSTAILDGFTITAGNADSDYASDLGGGGIYLSSASPTINNCMFIANSAVAPSGYRGSGGGMYNYYSSPSLTNCSFVSNAASYLGGGVYNMYSSPTITGCVFTGNSADWGSSSECGGGGIGNQFSSFPSLINCRFIANSAYYGGGMSVANSSSATLTDCVFIGNSSSHDGGGIRNSSSSLALTNCTFIANSAAGSGGGISSDTTSSVLTNCILWANTAQFSRQINGSATVSYSDVQGGFAGTGNVNVDPLLVRYPSAGLDAIWGTADDDSGDLRLRPISPVADAGNSAAPKLIGITTDLAGNPRFADIPFMADTGSGTAPIVDMGAYEAQPAADAWTAGPYRVRQGPGLPLSGVGSGSIAGSLDFAWDWDNDGLYDDATGPNPVFPTSGYSVLTTVPIRLRVTDAAGQSATASTTITVVPAVVYVDDSAKGSGNGGSWTNAFTSLQSALGIGLVPGCELRVAAGVYKPTGTADRTISFQLQPGVAMYGGYAGFGATDPDVRDIAAYPTILSGDIGTPNSATDNSYHVVTGTGIDSTAILAGFTITGGRANGSYGSTYNGGGIYLSAASPTLLDCTFTANSAPNYSGGGLFARDLSSPRLTDCIFTANSAYSGGGMWSAADSSSPVLTDCVFVANAAELGGGMYNGSSSATLSNCTFTANSASNSGGGLYTTSSLVLRNCILWANTAPTGGQISGSVNASFSDIQGGLAGSGNVDVDPFFFRNPSAGVDGVWRTADDDYGDLRLRSFSPIADAGDNDAPSLTGITTDLAGNARFVDIPTTADTGSGTAPLIDMGAYEAQVVSLEAWVAGPYRVLQGTNVGLSGWGSSSAPGALSFAWDWDNDGFDDAAGPNPVFSTSGYSSLTTAPIRLRVTNGAGQSVIASTTITIVPAVLYVDDSAKGTGDGSSWTNGFTSLQSALGLGLLPGCEIRVAAGSYKPTNTTDRTISFQLQSGVALYGGYAGVGAANPDARDTSLYPAILSGDIGISNSAFDNSYHVVTGTSVDATAILDGFTVISGNANGGSAPTNCGGGIYLSSGCSTVRNCTFRANSASSGGGAYLSSSPATFVNCTFAGNAASTFSADSGGGLYLLSSSPTLIDCSIVGNAALYDGGGIYDYASSPVLTNCVFIANSASHGGGMKNVSSSYPTLTNCTFTANAASAYGGGMYDLGCLPVLTNCILWGNTAPSCSQIDTSATVSYSDIQGGAAGTGNVNVDPRFVRSPAPGPDRVWCTADDDFGDLRLHGYSPVADAGNNNAPKLAGMTTDFAGNPRYADIATTGDTGSGTAPIVDMGAYEARPAMEAVASGPYKVRQGQSLSLPGFGSSTVTGSLDFAWDWDNDGLYDDASGPTPVFPTAGYALPVTLPISLRVTDAAGQSATASTTVTIVPAVLYVDDSAKGTGDGSSWTNAFTSLQSALGMAAAGCEIRVAAGTYKPASTADRSVSFQLPSGVAIYGGYAGVGAVSPDARDVALYASILSGDIGTPGSNIDNSYHVVSGSGLDGSAILNGFMITGGNANGVSPNDCGGGMYLASASPTLINCIIVANSAAYDGGGIYNYSSSPAVTNCVFIGNSAPHGGGMKNYSSCYPKLTNCTFTANSASFYGGGMYDLSSTPVLTNCILWANTAPTSSQVDSSATITYSDVQGGFTGTGNVNVNPQFVRMPSAGTDGVWGTGDDDFGNLRLALFSPVIDAGSNAASGLAGITTDLDGQARFVNSPWVVDTGSGTAPIVDMGAYEDDIPNQIVTWNGTTGNWTDLGKWVGGSSFPNDGNGGFNYSVIINSGTVTLNQSITIQNLILGDGATLAVSAGSVLTVNSLTINGNGRLDLGGQAMFVKYSGGVSPMADVTSWVKSGRNGGTWDGSGIGSGAAAGNSGYGLGVVDDVANQQVKVMCTLLGDTNLDGKVDVGDLGTLLNSYGQSGKTWSDGEFAYNAAGTVDVGDLGLLLNNYGQTAALAALTDAVVSVGAVTAGDDAAVTQVVDPGASVGASVAGPSGRQLTDAARRDVGTADVVTVGGGGDDMLYGDAGDGAASGGDVIYGSRGADALLVPDGRSVWPWSATTARGWAGVDAAALGDLLAGAGQVESLLA